MKTGYSKPFLLVVTFVLSLSVLSLEVALTRVYSYLLWYHYVFAAISVSVLGLGLGSWWVYTRTRRRDTTLPLKAGMGAFALSLLVVLPLIFVLSSTSAWMLALLLSALPFLFAGIILATIFTLEPEESTTLYGADLGGAALGALAAPFFLNLAGPIGVIAGIALVTFVLYVFLAGRKAIALALIGMIAAGTTFWFGNSLQFARLFVPSGKSMESFINNSRGDVQWFASKWGAFSRLDVVGDQQDLSRGIFTDGAAGTELFRFDGDPKSMEYLKEDLNYLPFVLKDGPKTAIIGPGGGKEVHLALLGGSDDITAIEVNPEMYKVARRLSDYAGNIYDRPEVKAVVADGRGFLERASERYDVIFLPLVLTMAAEAKGYALAEDYVFTKEAFATYYDRLNPQGYVALRLHDEAEMLRAILTWMDVLKQKAEVGPKKALGGIGVFFDLSHNHSSGSSMPFLLLKKGEFTEQELRTMYWFAGQNPIRMVGYIPNYVENNQLGLIRKGAISLEELLAQVPADVTPVSDDRPFFYDTQKGLPGTIPLLLAVVSFFALVVFSALTASHKAKSGKRLSVYFALLGLAFMLVEIPLLQKLTLLFGTPVQALSLTLFALLLSGGAGSYLAGRFSMAPERRARNVSLVLGVLAVAYVILLPPVVRLLMVQNEPVRILGGILLVVPLGILMGMPFPNGLKFTARLAPEGVALAWAVNGVFSVVGSVLTVAMAMSLGLTSSIVLGGIFYFAAGFLLQSVEGFSPGKD